MCCFCQKQQACTLIRQQHRSAEEKQKGTLNTKVAAYYLYHYFPASSSRKQTKNIVYESQTSKNRQWAACWPKVQRGFSKQIYEDLNIIADDLWKVWRYESVQKLTCHFLSRRTTEAWQGLGAEIPYPRLHVMLTRQLEHKNLRAPECVGLSVRQLNHGMTEWQNGLG